MCNCFSSFWVWFSLEPAFEFLSLMNFIYRSNPFLDIVKRHRGDVVGTISHSRSHTREKSVFCIRHIADPQVPNSILTATPILPVICLFVGGKYASIRLASVFLIRRVSEIGA